MTFLVSPGDGLPVTLYLTPAWLVPASGTVTIPIVGSLTTTVAPGTYEGILTVTTAGTTKDAYKCKLKFLASPGYSTLSQTSYISIDDVHQICPWLDSLQDDESDAAGFAADLLWTRQLLDRSVMRSWRGNMLLAPFGNMSAILQPFFGMGVFRTPMTPLWLQQQLAANTLIVTPELRSALAHLAAARILRRNLSKNNSFVRYAADHETRGISQITALVVELATGGGTSPTIAIPMSQVNLLQN